MIAFVGAAHHLSLDQETDQFGVNADWIGFWAGADKHEHAVSKLSKSNCLIAKTRLPPDSVGQAFAKGCFRLGADSRS